jgi:hypothetical protein
VRERTPGEDRHRANSVSVAISHHLEGLAEPNIMPVLTDPRAERRADRDSDRLAGIHPVRRSILLRRASSSGSSPAQ